MIIQKLTFFVLLLFIQNCILIGGEIDKTFVQINSTKKEKLINFCFTSKWTEKKYETSSYGKVISEKLDLEFSKNLGIQKCNLNSVNIKNIDLIFTPIRPLCREGMELSDPDATACQLWSVTHFGSFGLIPIFGPMQGKVEVFFNEGNKISKYEYFLNTYNIRWLPLIIVTPITLLMDIPEGLYLKAIEEIKNETVIRVKENSL
ncbi:hypothetical protein QRD38_11345 [Leptospira weilii]|uniref:hypothetical protein n=1 Tax=Leptospira weilii TaxID=28184 RepID=UPI00256EE823|nr:hypothetical protein [Leptospira weilii]MDL5246370.1 hypothetical protein [Leptospira weilii]